MICRTRFVIRIATLLVVVSVSASRVVSAEQLSAAPERGTQFVPSSMPTLESRLTSNFAELSQGLLTSRIDLPRQPRVTRSHRPLRRITLVGGDRFVAECLDWRTDIAAFRLLSGQVIRLPISAVATLANPPREVDLIVESFEAGSSIESEPTLRQMLDETQAAGGRRSLRIDATAPGYRQSFDRPRISARIEFSFRTAIYDSAFACGEWQLEGGDHEARQTPFVVRLGSDRSISVAGVAPDAESMSQSLKLTDGWHSFVALIASDRIRLIVDDAILASCPTVHSPFRAIHFRPVDKSSKNVLWIDELHVRSLGSSEDFDRASSETIDRDVMLTATGDELFGRIIGVTDAAATLDALGDQRSLPWNRLAGLAWHQPSEPIRQTSKPSTGVVSRIEMQPFVDRPECEPERWTVTIVRFDAKQLIVQHALIGELKFHWSDVRRVDPLFFGQTLLADARRFHLGNSTRPDFHRQLPDGTELQGDFVLPEIPLGRPYLSLDVAELEAAGPDAPPGSPFLAQLRAGNLVTELLVNDQRIGHLNQYIRFKTSSQNPDRIRLAIPKNILNRGRNTFRLKQHPLKYHGREFDDCEVGHFRLEFDQTGDEQGNSAK